jgi:hypothetical protein
MIRDQAWQEGGLNMGSILYSQNKLKLHQKIHHSLLPLVSLANFNTQITNL